MRKVVLIACSALLVPALRAADPSIPTLLGPEIVVAHPTTAPSHVLASWQADQPRLTWADAGAVRTAIPGQRAVTIADEAQLGAVAAGPSATLIAFSTAQGLFTTLVGKEPVLIDSRAGSNVRAVWTGTDFLLVWYRDLGLWGGRVSADGRFISGPHSLVTAPFSKWFEIAAAAGNVLLFYRGDYHGMTTIAARLLTPFGIEGACGPALGNTDGNVAVVSDGLGFLIRWVHTPADIAPGDPISRSSVHLKAIEFSGRCLSDDDVEYELDTLPWFLMGTENGYLRVSPWRRVTGETQLGFARYTSAGLPIEGSMTLGGWFYGDFSSIARNGSGEMLVAYRRPDSRGTQILARYLTFGRMRAAHR